MSEELKRTIKQEKEKIQQSIRTIAKHFGLEMQKGKTVEECNELIQAIKNEDFENIVEEIADVWIMLQQLIYLYGIENNVNEVIEQKIQRTINRYSIEVQDE
jgi:NTP pyrophosphatase (non-canonical NTP hydrolase)